MGAFNEIIVCDECPVCYHQVKLIVQTHVASSFEGDETGRFCHQRYNLGEEMRWWPKEDARYIQWRENGRSMQRTREKKTGNVAMLIVLSAKPDFIFSFDLKGHARLLFTELD